MPKSSKLDSEVPDSKNQPSLFFTAEASARVNLMGEHTDYNLGWVLPTALPLKCTLNLRSDQSVPHKTIRFVSRQFNSGLLIDPFVDYPFQANPLASKLPKIGAHSQHWSHYGLGVIKHLESLFPGVLEKKLFSKLNSKGVLLTIDSNIPMGSGLSSSAALLVAYFRLFREVLKTGGANPFFDDLALAQFVQLVENDSIGARVGILDPMAICFSSETQAMFLDTRGVDYSKVTRSDEGTEGTNATQDISTHSNRLKPELITVPRPHIDWPAQFIVIHSGITHSNASSKSPTRNYNTRRAECETAAQLMGIQNLRCLHDLPEPKAKLLISALPELYRKRATHIFTENLRVFKAKDCLQSPDRLNSPSLLGELFWQSHRSQSEDYDVSTPELDLLIDLLKHHPAVYGARLTGGGFGGSVVVLGRPDPNPKITFTHQLSSLLAAYKLKTGCTPQLFETDPSNSSHPYSLETHQ